LKATLHPWRPWASVKAGKLPVAVPALADIAVLRRFNPDVLHVHGGLLPDDIFARYALTASAIVLTPHGSYYPQVLRGRLRAYATTLRPLLQARLTGLHALSPAEASILHERFPSREPYVIPNGITPFTTNEHGRRHAEQPSYVRIAYVGRLDVFTKGLDILLEALAVVLSQRDVRLTLIGPAAQSDAVALTRQISQLGLERYVTMTGMLDRAQVGMHLHQTDLFVQPSRWDACSLASIEAIASGVPAVLSTNNGVSGFKFVSSLPHVKVAAPAADAVASALLDLIGNLAAAKAAARQHSPAVLRFFSWDRVAREHHQMYGRLQGRH
jgi:glycosyltransferase involved in cell wall biosynthesis